MATRTVAVRPVAAAAWPPVAERQAVELSTPAVLGILAAGLAVDLLVFAAAARTLRPVSSIGPATSFLVRGLVIPGALTLGLSVGLVVLLGWHRVAGLGAGWSSRWGTIPFAVLWLGAVATMAQAGASTGRMAMVWIFLLGVVLAAAAEEVLFRGFLLHGLTRTMGGGAAVLLGSALFASAHVPSLVASHEAGGGLGLTLVVLFGLAVFLCRVRAETGSIWLCSGVHALWNFVTIGVVGRDPSDGLAAGIVMLKFVPVAIGITLAIRLARSAPARDPVPPTPPARAGALVFPGLERPAAGAGSPFVPPAPRSALPPSPPPARPDLP